uniref:Cyclin-like domain-containing protein n=1 Tax=Spongospora subterranea TaxID=70186 RepID=A0A0H5QVF9_9EUKA|eukprot:CRZ05890.1 hypothetical protein [Spongospora subterranea]
MNLEDVLWDFDMIPSQLQQPDMSKEMYEIMIDNENRFYGGFNYMEYKEGFTYESRSRLIAWIREVGNQPSIEAQTIFMAVAILDRFFSIGDCIPKHWQLAAAASLFLASKYNDSKPIRVSILRNSMQEPFCKEDIYAMELMVLYRLDFEISIITSWEFASLFLDRLFQMLGRRDPILTKLTLYFLEICLENEISCEFFPSDIGGAALAVASWYRHHRLSKQQRTRFAKCCISIAIDEYDKTDVVECFRSIFALHNLIISRAATKSIVDRYGLNVYLRILPMPSLELCSTTREQLKHVTSTIRIVER